MLVSSAKNLGATCPKFKKTHICNASILVETIFIAYLPMFCLTCVGRMMNTIGPLTGEVPLVEVKHGNQLWLNHESLTVRVMGPDGAVYY